MRVADGDYLAPGEYAMGVAVTPRTVKGEKKAERVFWVMEAGTTMLRRRTTRRRMYVAEFKLTDLELFFGSRRYWCR